MADQHASVEAEEQIDLDGDNEIEDMMDDEEFAEDDGYRQIRDEYMDQGSAGNVSYRRMRDEYQAEDPADDDSYKRSKGDHQDQEQDCGFEDNEKDKVSEFDEGIDASDSMKNEERKVVPENVVDKEKHTELLSLPPHGSEVFIGGLPRDATEVDLRVLCEPFGEIFEVKLVKDKEKQESKGFAFLSFTTNDAAQKAIEQIQDKEFKGRTLRCSLSEVKHKLFIGNAPKHLTEEELRKLLDETSPGVENIECFKDPQNPNRNRGFLFVEYYNHACAEYARQKMSNVNFKMAGNTPTIKWAEPKNAAEASGASQVKALYVKNLPDSATSEKLKTLFERHGEVIRVVLPPPKSGQSKRDFGFVYFAERSSALRAVKGTEKYEIDGQVIEAVIAKPQNDKRSGHASNPYKAGQLPNYPQYPYGYPPGDPYGAYNGGYGSAGLAQPVIYGRGPTPAGMRMVPMVLPDGRIGYVLQGTQVPPPPPSRRSDRGGGSREAPGRDTDKNNGRRYCPY